MKNISEIMNNIDIRSSSEAGLILESMGVVTLGKFWNRIMLSGDYWRFYYHNAPGAGVLVKGCRMEFAMNRCYLLPPACDLESFCSGSPEQFFIHAELTGSRYTQPSGVIELPEGFESGRIELLRSSLIAGAARSPAVRLAALTLMANALALLPEKAWSSPAMDSRVAAVRDYINTRLNEDISLDLLAQRSAMAPASLLRLFKRECGVTPYQYIMQQRYNCAARLLKNSNLPIESICDSVGVKDRFHFSRQFKKLFGMPPAAYRECYKLD